MWVQFFHNHSKRGDLLIGGGQCSIDGMGSKLLQLFNA